MYVLHHYSLVSITGNNQKCPSSCLSSMTLIGHSPKRISRDFLGAHRVDLFYVIRGLWLFPFAAILGITINFCAPVHLLFVRPLRSISFR